MPDGRHSRKVGKRTATEILQLLRRICATAKRYQIIDDDPAMHDLVRRTLEKEGIAVIPALSGEEGIALARQLKPAIPRTGAGRIELHDELMLDRHL